MKKRYLLVALLLAVLMTATCTMALAEGDVPPPGLLSDNPNFSVYEWHRSVVPFASDDELYFIRTVTSITKLSSTSVYIRGVTETNKICDQVGGTLVLQQWKNSTWNNYYTSTFSFFVADAAEATRTVTVDSGYYYRLAIRHRASRAPEYINKNTYTGSILVN